MQEFLSTRTSADINLGLQITLLIGLWIGFYFARTRQITRHKNMQTSMVLAQLVLIAFVMATSFYKFVISGETYTGKVAQLMMVHGFFGTITEISGIYLILRMRTQLIPQSLRVRNYKLMMRSTLALWTIVAGLGFAIYYFRYLEEETVIVAAPLDQLRQAGDDLVVHADELREAIVDRENLATAKRHAEHIVSLIEGVSGEHYGDLDQDGTVEDPGDGTGLLSYLQDVESATTEQDIVALSKTVRQSLDETNAHALSVIQARDIAIVETLGKAAFDTAEGANSGIVELKSKAEDAGVQSITIPVPDVAGQLKNTKTVVLLGFQFINKEVIINKGQTVVWVNNEAPKHTATSDDGVFKSESLSRDDSYAFTFNETGEFPYYCRFHGDKGGVGMSGKILVEE